MQLKKHQVFIELARALTLKVSIFKGIEEFFKRFTVLKNDHRKLRHLLKQRPVKMKHEQAHARSVEEKVCSSEVVENTKMSNNSDHQATPSNFTTHVSDTDESSASSMDPVTSTPNGLSAKVLDSALSPIEKV